MGPKSSTNTGSNKQAKEEINRNQFEFLYVIGKGGFGKVWKVQSKKFKKQYALKEMSKAKIIDKKSEKSIKYERELLSRLKHPFIVNMQYAFQDYENLFLVMDLLTGGDLRYHISRHKRFSEEQTRFFVACILLGLEYLHNNNVLHRDIKPENLVLDERGYVRITDFGIAKLYQKENSSETSGTPGYMSPEVMCAQNHTIAVDYFAVGVIAYEFMNGRRPYIGRSRKEIKEQIMAKQVQVKISEVPEGWGEDAADFTNRLLQRKPAHRLGLKGAQEVKDHPWLKYYPWKELYDKTLEAPFVPKIGDNFDRKYCESQDKVGNSTIERYQKYMREENFTVVFQNFTYINYNEAGINQPLEKELAHPPSHLQRANSSTTSSSKLINSNSQKKYNMNLLKTKVKIVDNASHSASTTNISSNIISTIKKDTANVNNANNANNVNNANNANINNNINYTNQKIAQNVNNFYNNYIHHHAKSNSVIINSSSLSNINNMNSNSSGTGKYTPYKDKKYSNVGSNNNNNNILIENAASSAGGNKKDFNFVNKNSSSSTNNNNMGSTSTASLMNMGNRLFNSKLPNINTLEKLKLTKKLSGSSSNVNIFKSYSKQNSNSQSSTGSSINSSLKFFNK